MIRVRKPALELTADAIPRHWHSGSAVATHIANGVNLLFPAGERFFVRSVNHFLDQITDEHLRAEVRGFFGQEGSHARAHEHDLERLRQQGYRVDGFLRVYQRIAYGIIEKLTPAQLNLAGTAAAEHFTAIMAEGALAGGALDGAHPEMRKLLMWHAAEEIEHKHVAFDVLRAINPSYALRVAGLALATVSLTSFWFVAATMLMRQEGLSLAEVRQGLRGIGKKRNDAPIFLRGIREYLRRDFHPRQHDNYALAAAYLAQAGLERAPRAEAA